MAGNLLSSARMKFCLNTSTIKPQPLLKKIELAGTAGYDGIELWLNDIYDHIGRGGEVKEVEQALADHGLTVPGTIAIRQWGESDGWEYELVKDEARRRFALAARLGSPYIVATPPLEMEHQEHLPERYRDLLQIGREEGINPTFEYISFFKSVYNLADAWRIVQETDDEDTTLILDAFHTWNSNSDPELHSVNSVHKIRSVNSDLHKACAGLRKPCLVLGRDRDFQVPRRFRNAGGDVSPHLGSRRAVRPGRGRPPGARSESSIFCLRSLVFEVFPSKCFPSKFSMYRKYF